MLDPAGKRFLLLQGPMGPFFRRLADDLLAAGAAAVDKVNFNGGDRYYYPGGIDYKDEMDRFDCFLDGIISRQRYDKVVVFGDTRPMHLIARKVAAKHDVKLVVFEEGYLRPHFVTCEVGGVNGFSSIPRDPDFYRRLDAPVRYPKLAGNKKFNPGPYAWFHAWKYGYEMKRCRNEFSFYRHNRTLTWGEGFRWVGWSLRKRVLRVGADKQKLDVFFSGEGCKFLVPLQVANDSQVLHHSRFPSVGAFIEWSIMMFSIHAPDNARMLIKHHPLDPHHNYDRLISDMSKRYDCADRIWYVVEGHLPTILQRVDGVFTINSTVGMSALHHGRPTCVSGNAVYEMPGLATSDAGRFLQNPLAYAPDKDLYLRFKGFLLTRNQAVGSFYRPLSGRRGEAGLVWPRSVKIKRGAPAKGGFKFVPAFAGFLAFALGALVFWRD